MGTGEVMDLVLLALVWACWCAQHSLLIDPRVVDWFLERVPAAVRYYRLAYNGVALVSIIPPLLLTHYLDGQPVFSWHGYMAVIRYGLLGAAILLFYGGAQRYDLGFFLGLRQFRSGERHQLLSDEEGFAADGVFGITRHPWYLGSLLFLWTIKAHYALSTVIAFAVLSLYLVVGTWLEERKIIRLYGDEYRAYQQKVSMLFPWKYLARIFHE